MRATRFMLIMFALLAIASLAVAQTQSHTPYTVKGVQVRTDIVMSDNTGRPMDMGPNAFQEVAPCRVISTLKSDNLTPPWDGPAFAAGEARFYSFIQYLYSDNPCVTKVPNDALAVALRVQAVNPDKDGAIYLTPGTWAPFTGTRAVELKAGQNAIEEAAVMIRGGGFYVASQSANTDLTVDLLGYFVADPHGAGPKGDKGDTGEIGPKGEIGPPGVNGETGPAGPQGIQGLRGEVGATGPQGPQGLKGDTGATGPQGPQGLKGDTGATGPQGPQGLKGDTGATGPQGPQGLKGDTGATGPQGPQGESGPAGPPGKQGEVGPAGPQGLQGERGPQGEPGATGPAGPQGLQGERGPQGEIGPAGPIGPQGPKGDTGATGPQGPPGPSGFAGAGFGVCIPHGGQFKIVYDANIHTNSFIALTRLGDSTSNTFSIHDQSEGWMKISGQSEACFNYAVFNP